MSMKKIAESFSDLKSTEIINAEKNCKHGLDSQFLNTDFFI